MDQRIANILVTCTKRKRKPVSRALHLRHIETGGPVTVARKWFHRLEQTKKNLCAASSLYAGDHWKIAQSLPAGAQDGGVKARLWVISAGYGLIPAGAELAPYSATFSVGHPDEVLGRFAGERSAMQLREWWAALSKFPGPVAGEHRSIAKLVEANPKAPIVVVASPQYLKAIEPDLLAAREHLAASQSLIIVSAGSQRRGALESNMVTCSGELQAALGGALMSLNTRVTRKILEIGTSWPWTVDGFNKTLRSIPPYQARPPAVARTTVTDADVRWFVRSCLVKDPNKRATTLLRMYRDAGYACEQKRFRKLFQQALKDNHVRTK